MKTRCLAVLGLALGITGFGYAGTINSFTVQLGSWDGSTFTPDGSNWNTYNSANWAVGATAPGFGNPLLDGFNSVNLPDGEYYLYMADNGDPDAQAVEITLGYSDSSTADEIFTDPNGATVSGSYTLVSGSGFTANLVTGPQTTHTTVGSGQVYSSTDEANWVVDVNSTSSVPEPATWTLFVLGCGVLAIRRKGRHAKGSN